VQEVSFQEYASTIKEIEEQIQIEKHKTQEV
jgi:hypothetical protein